MSRSTNGLNVDDLTLTDKNFEILKKELVRLRMNNEEQMIAIKLNNISDFVLLFMAQLPISRTSIEAFNKLNDLYFDYYGEYRYSSYQKFSRARVKYLESRR